jgi:hypothetical protein
MAIVESFVTNELVRRLEREVPEPRSRIVETVYVRAEEAATASWPQLQTHYKQWLDVRFTTFPAWTRIRAVNNVRNAIAHGLGEITRRMARDGVANLRRDFRPIGVEIIGTSLRVSDQAVKTAVVVCRDFVLWLDIELTGYDGLATAP